MSTLQRFVILLALCLAAVLVPTVITELVEGKLKKPAAGTKLLRPL